MGGEGKAVAEGGGGSQQECGRDGRLDGPPGEEGDKVNLAQVLASHKKLELSSGLKDTTYGHNGQYNLAQSKRSQEFLRNW